MNDQARSKAFEAVQSAWSIWEYNGDKESLLKLRDAIGSYIESVKDCEPDELEEHYESWENLATQANSMTLVRAVRAKLYEMERSP